MKATTAFHSVDCVLAMQHFVKDDPIEEVSRHTFMVQQGVDAYQPILHGKAAGLDRSAVGRAAGNAPSNTCVMHSAKVFPVEALIYGGQVMVMATSAQDQAPRAPGSTRNAVLIPFYEVAEQPGRPLIVVHNVTSQRSHQPWLYPSKHPVSSDTVLPPAPHRDNRVPVVREAQAYHLPGRQVARQGSLQGQLFGRPGNRRALLFHRAKMLAAD
jgi:hypothetical protein